MSSNDYTRRSRSQDLDPDEDADYQFALKLSAELNGEQSPSPAHQPGYDEDAEFARAMQRQYDSEMLEADQQSFMPHTESTWGASSAPSTEQTAWGLGGQDDSKVVEYNPETPSGTVLKTFADFTAHLKSSKCSRCNEPFFQSELDVNSMFQKWLNDKATLSSWIKCTRCSTSSCITCTPEPFAKPSTISFQGQKLSWCCVGGRVFLIWMLLCGFDQHFCASRSKGAIKAKPTQQTQNSSRSKTKLLARGGGVGFGGSHRPQMSYMPNGMGYGSDTADLYAMGDWFGNPSFKGQGQSIDPRNRIQPINQDSKAMAQNAQQADDNFNRLVLELLKDLLPAYNRETGFDMDPPETVTDMLLHSKILSYCAELLRNDSLDDATKRKELYHALFSFLQTIGMHAMATRTLFSERLVRPDEVNVLTLSFVANPNGSKDMASPIADSLHKLNTQSLLVLQNARSNEQDFRTEDGQNMLLLCCQISEFSQYILANINAASLCSDYTAREDLSIIDVSDEQILATHAYAATAKALNFSPPGRFKRLITEITTLKTGLPPGIFVRYCENRPDVLKVAIIGPGGTPYENGIFEFDFFCDASFPARPPSVQFRGTGGGRISINPNLYADGKVCLSLLGTWQGEPWVSSESTLLQVVISLQAMILCEEPWYNEPGREAGYHRGSGYNPAAAYNQKIREHTVRYAILTWLDQPPPLWQAVIDQHFKQNANKILQTAEEWAKTKTPAQPSHAGWNDEGNDFNYFDDVAALGRRSVAEQGDLASMLPRLQTALHKYGATFVIKCTTPPVVRQSPAPRSPRHHPSGHGVQAFYPEAPLGSMPLEPPPSYSVTAPVFPPAPFNSGNGSRGGFWGLGQILGGNRGGHAAGLVVPNTTGGPFRGASSDIRGRYETRTATHGRGGLGKAGDAGSPTNKAPPNIFGAHSPRGRGGPGSRGGPGGYGRGGPGSLP